jgi:L,D-peptidoglycan transpeptidase YkuD (ErfK/YbiS/YcfS/YnhG family)
MIFPVYPDGRMRLGRRLVRCALGREGVCVAAEKREGDGRTPAGLWPLRRLLWRADRRPAPGRRLPAMAIGPRDGWCDDPGHLDYNRPVRLPHPARGERLWRADHLYDVVVVLGHNDDPVVPGAGSAIFLHLAAAHYRPTQGCVALAPPDLALFLRLASPGDAIEVRPPRGAN